MYAPPCTFYIIPELNIVASFDRRGERIVTGSSKGKVQLLIVLGHNMLTFMLSFI